LRVGGKVTKEEEGKKRGGLGLSQSSASPPDITVKELKREEKGKESTEGKPLFCPLYVLWRDGVKEGEGGEKGRGSTASLSAFSSRWKMGEDWGKREGKDRQSSLLLDHNYPHLRGEGKGGEEEKKKKESAALL